MNTLLWIIGRGGLLGSALATAAREKGYDTWEQTGRTPWSDDHARDKHLHAQIGEFFRSVGNRPWAVAWAAGDGVVGSPEEKLLADTSAFGNFLEALSQAKKELSPSKGTVVLASSAGAVYPPVSTPLTEDSPTGPLSRYGQEKLRQEELLRRWSSDTHDQGLSLRFSNLYGPHQRRDKRQGFISHLSRCIIQRRPLHLFVPLSTVRDYLHADDAAHAALEALGHMQASTETSCVKIIAAERGTSLAEIVGTFAAITKRRPPLVCAPSALSSTYPMSVSFRSTRWRNDPIRRRPLSEGIGEVHRGNLELHRRGLLPLG